MLDCTSLRQLVPVQDKLYSGLRKIEPVQNHIKPELQHKITLKNLDKTTMSEAFDKLRILKNNVDVKVLKLFKRFNQWPQKICKRHLPFL